MGATASSLSNIDRVENGTLLPVAKMDIVKDSPITVVMDASSGMGMAASRKMMEMLIEKASRYGMAGGAIYNSTHYGIAGYWSGMAEKAGTQARGWPLGRPHRDRPQGQRRFYLPLHLR